MYLGREDGNAQSFGRLEGCWNWYFVFLEWIGLDTFVQLYNIKEAVGLLVDVVSQIGLDHVLLDVK